MKEFIPLTGRRAWAKSNRTTLGHDVLVHLELLDCTSGCPGVQWCPGPDLGGDPPGTSVVSLTQMSGVHTSTWDTQTTEYHFELQMSSDSLPLLFSFWLSEFSLNCHQTICHPFVPNTLLSPHVQRDFSPHRHLMCSFIFLCSVFVD